MDESPMSMAGPTDDWLTFARRDWPIRFLYPDPTPSGCPVSIAERNLETGQRFHFTSTGSEELYFEVGKYRGRTLSEAAGEFLADVRGRLEGLTVSPGREIEIAGAAGTGFEIAWTGKRRRVHFVEKGTVLFRVIFDPDSALNERILATLVFEA